jgi:hypothetical protein
VKIIECEQGSAEWLKARCGIPTASRFADIVTPTGRAVTSKARRDYMLELLAERLTGSTEAHYVTAAMERGKALEPQARAWYSLETGKAVCEVGFVVDDSGDWGCSPDGVTDCGGIEIKCLTRTRHLDALLTRTMPPEYMVQIQACMWIMRRATWDFVLFTDERGIPSATWQIEADAKLHAAFAEHVPAFVSELCSMERTMKAC